MGGIELKKLIILNIIALLLLGNPVLASENPLASLGFIDNQPRLLAPGFINTGMATRDLTMTPDGNEIYFCSNSRGYTHAFILVTRFIHGAWTTPEVVSFSGNPDFIDLEPALSPDGQSLFFYSTRPAYAGAKDSQDLWVVRRMGNLWGEPENLGLPVNTPAAEFFPSVTADGTLYFCRADSVTRRHAIYRSRMVDGKYAEPQKLPIEVNSGTSQFNAWISPGEDRLIVPVAGHPDNYGGVDYWLCGRNEDDSWQPPINLGPLVNDGSNQSWSPFVSPDGENFFFMSSRTVGEPMSWPISWSELQHRHQHPGSGRPGIFVMKADFLDDPLQGVPKLEPQEPKFSMDSSPYMGKPGRYWGQNPPGRDPEIFAPGLISTGLGERDICISPDGRFLMYGVMDLGLMTIMVAQWQAESWSEPISAPWHKDKDFACFEPAFTPDGKTVFFLSNRAAPGQEQGPGWSNQNIFTSDLEGDHWSEAVALPAPITTEKAEYFPSVAADGTLYFSREDEQGHPAIWMAARQESGFGEPVRLPAEVNAGQDNYNAFISPDQSLIIVCIAGHDRDSRGRAIGPLGCAVRLARLGIHCSRFAELADVGSRGGSGGRDSGLRGRRGDRLWHGQSGGGGWHFGWHRR